MEIEKNVPLPKHRTPLIPPMEIGDSVYVATKNLPLFRANLNYYSYKVGQKFATRAEDQGIRVWRIK